jgi:hypothetical protein
MMSNRQYVTLDAVLLACFRGALIGAELAFAVMLMIPAVLTVPL